MSEFIKWSKTPHWDIVRLRITQKLDGTNAQILIEDNQPYGLTRIRAGSRTRWLGEITRTNKKHKDGTPYVNETVDDNHGFYKWVMENKEELIEKLGPGRYYGEWCGPGIQNGENLTERGLFLFYPPKNCETLPNGVHLVPEIFNELINLTSISAAIHSTRYSLQLLGTQIHNSLLIKNPTVKPEGLIIQIDSQRYKWRFKE